MTSEEYLRIVVRRHRDMLGVTTAQQVRRASRPASGLMYVATSTYREPVELPLSMADELARLVHSQIREALSRVPLF